MKRQRTGIWPMVDLWIWQTVDLWNGVFGLVAAIVGGVITGFFMLWQQRREFRQRASDAMRALFIELQYDRDLVIELQAKVAAMRDMGPPMVASLVPVQIRRTMWDTLLPLVAGPLDKVSGLEDVDRAYRGVDFVRGLALSSEGTYRIEAQEKPEIIAVRDHLTRAIAAVRRAAGLPDQPKS
jgi:hypothetical protein